MLGGITRPHRANAPRIHEALSSDPAEHRALNGLLGDAVGGELNASGGFEADLCSLLVSARIPHVRAESGEANRIVRMKRKSITLIPEPDVNSIRGKGILCALGSAVAAKSRDQSDLAIVVVPYVPPLLHVSTDILRENGVLIGGISDLTRTLIELRSAGIAGG
jgi:hypothetical protein